MTLEKTIKKKKVIIMKTTPIPVALHKLLELKWKNGNVISGLKRKRLTFITLGRDKTDVREYINLEKQHENTRIAGRKYKIVVSKLTKLNKVTGFDNLYHFRVTIVAKDIGSYRVR